MRIDGSRWFGELAGWLWLVLVPVPSILACDGLTTGSSAHTDPAHDGGTGSDRDAAHPTTDGRAPSLVDCATLSVEACAATPSCLPILASRYDAFSNCQNPPEAVACATTGTTCAAKVTVARSNTGECRVFTSTCLAAGWSPVTDPTNGCGSSINTSGPICKETFGPCPANPCPVTIIGPESPADGAAGPTSCSLVVPVPAQGQILPVKVANLYRLTVSGPEPVRYVVDAARCDPANGGWYYGETDAGPTSMELCPITCAVPRDTLQQWFGCPTLRADGSCMQ